MENNKLKLSHVLYHVKDLHNAVKKLRNAGFIVEYGTHPDKAYNALIWFEEGIFIEIYQNSGLPSYIKWMMKIFGYSPILKRIEKWERQSEGWCEWSLESVAENLNSERKILRAENIAFKFHKAKRIDINQLTLRWELVMPNDINFPFIMSAYKPNPRPKSVKHPNGAKGVKKIVVGKDHLNTELLTLLINDNPQLELSDGTGLITVQLEGSGVTIENILNPKSN